MLVLSRKVGQQIIIGDGVVLTVLSFDKGKVRLGFEGDKEIPIHRAELLEREPTYSSDGARKGGRAW